VLPLCVAAVELHRAGGIGVLTKRLIEGGFVDGDALTVTGRTLGEECEGVRETAGQEVVAPLSQPLRGEGGLVVLRGSLAPEGSVVKVTQHTPTSHRGPARVFNREEDAFAAVTGGKVKPGDTLFSIATQFGTSVKALQRLNPNIDPSALQVGQTLVVR